MAKKWFQKAVKAKPPDTLGGWHKTLPASTRRRRALSSRPRNWSTERKYRSAGRALNALANVTRDKHTKQIARADARYFFSKIKRR